MSYVRMGVENVAVDKSYVRMRIENVTVDKSYVRMRIENVTVDKSYFVFVYLLIHRYSFIFCFSIDVCIVAFSVLPSQRCGRGGGPFWDHFRYTLFSFRIISLFLLFTRFHISVCFLKIDTHYLFNTYYIFNHFLLIDVTTSSPITG